MATWIDLDDQRNCYIGQDGEYEKYNIDPDVIKEAKQRPEDAAANKAEGPDSHVIKHRKFTDLTKEEIRQVITDMFSPVKIVGIKTSKVNDEITCSIDTEWDADITGSDKPEIMRDQLTLRNPFIYGSGAIQIDFSLDQDDYTILKQFCFAKGICPWNENNPYLGEDKKISE